MRPESLFEQQSLTILEDVGLYLQDFITGLDNLPSEMLHIMAELRKKDEQFKYVRRRIKKRDQDLSRHYKVYGYGLENAHLVGQDNTAGTEDSGVPAAKDGADIAQPDVPKTTEQPAAAATTEATAEANATTTTATAEATSAVVPSVAEIKAEETAVTAVQLASTPPQAAAVIAMASRNGTAKDDLTPTRKSHQEQEQRSEKRRRLEYDMVKAIREDYRRADAIAQEKIKLTARARELLLKHIRILDNDLNLVAPEEDNAHGPGGTANARHVGRGRPSQHPLPSSLQAAAGINGHVGQDAAVRERITSPIRDATMVLDEPTPLQSPTAGVQNADGPALHSPTMPGLHRRRSNSAGIPFVIQTSITNDNQIIEEVVDANGEEPLYCYCRQVSYGDMVACDNDGCKFEWFHYDCVGLTEPPKGTWYCADCLATMKRPGF